MKPFIAYEGPSELDGQPIMGVVTRDSVNRKTGPMDQLWILRADVSPIAAVKSGADASICGDCVFRGDGTGAGRACYVTVAQAPSSVWRAYHHGGYERLSLSEVAEAMRGRSIRLGAYGDPAALPFDVVEALTRWVAGWTGYTHQWATGPAWLADYCMASVGGDPAEHALARALGYRLFIATAADADPVAVPGAVLCMAERSGRQHRRCIDCGACAGTRRGTVSGAVDISIRSHGNGARYVR